MADEPDRWRDFKPGSRLLLTDPFSGYDFVGVLKSKDWKRKEFVIFTLERNAPYTVSNAPFYISKGLLRLIR